MEKQTAVHKRLFFFGALCFLRGMVEEGTPLRRGSSSKKKRKRKRKKTRTHTDIKL